MEKNWNFEKRERKKEGPRPWQGVLVFLLVMVSFYTVIAWMQGAWGMYGLAATEFYLLALSLLAGRLTKRPLRELFPVKRPEWKKVLAVFLLWGSCYAGILPIIMTVTYFFPEEMSAVSGGLDSFIHTVPGFLIVLITCLLPGICEEALHRGFLLKSFQSKIRKKWVLILLLGFLFGVFHGSVWRFLPTALLGAALTYLMLETENLFYPALFHFVNNLFPFLLGGSVSGEQTEAASQLLSQGIPLYFLGVYTAMACILPFGLYTATYLMRKGEPGREQRYVTLDKTIVLLVVLTILPIFLGVGLFFFGLAREGLSSLQGFVF